MKAEELNTLVALSCTEPRWELVKFFFEDSPHTDTGVVITASLVTSVKRLATSVNYVVKEEIRDTEHLISVWDAAIENLKNRMVQRARPKVVASTQLDTSGCAYFNIAYRCLQGNGTMVGKYPLSVRKLSGCNIVREHYLGTIVTDYLKWYLMTGRIPFES